MYIKTGHWNHNCCKLKESGLIKEIKEKERPVHSHLLHFATGLHNIFKDMMFDTITQVVKTDMLVPVKRREDVPQKWTRMGGHEKQNEDTCQTHSCGKLTKMVFWRIWWILWNSTPYIQEWQYLITIQTKFWLHSPYLHCSAPSWLCHSSCKKMPSMKKEMP